MPEGPEATAPGGRFCCCRLLIQRGGGGYREGRTGWGEGRRRPGQRVTSSGLHCHSLSPMSGRDSQFCTDKIAGADLRKPTARPAPLPQGRGQTSPKEPPMAIEVITGYSSSCFGTAVLIGTGQFRIGLPKLFLLKGNIYTNSV